ncbi:MAG: hypothetical protein QXI39_03050 [Candidatus Bathyarchaeia archaeon]
MWERTHPLPLHALIVEALSRHGNSMSDEELFEDLKAIVKDLSISDLRKALFRLEIEGIVRVTGMAKNRKRIELMAGG